MTGVDSRLYAHRPRCYNWARRRGARVSLCEAADTIFFVGLHVVNGFFTHSLPGFFFLIHFAPTYANLGMSN